MDPQSRSRQLGSLRSRLPHRLLTANPKALRVFRARVILMAKAATRSNGKPVLTSRDVEALRLSIR